MGHRNHVQNGGGEDAASPVKNFYNGKNVFITGGTGFLGKLLIEKLLRSTNVSTLYLLVREKKGVGMHTRVDELLDDVLFERLKQEKPKYKHRVVGIQGQCELAGLGMNIHDRQLLIKNIDVVFHVAATVRFDERLDLAYAINVNGTGATVALCRQMEKLKSFIHVSTAYTNCYEDTIEERFYDYPVKYDDVGTMLDKMTAEEIENTTRQIIGKWPNTYTFTKALAEALIRDQATGLPVGVFRPGIVLSTYKEPVPSWINNMYGPIGMTAAVASGLIKAIHYDEKKMANIVPGDTCVAGLIAAGWEIGTMKCERTVENIRIYNYVSTVENPITWGEYTQINMLYGLQYPFSKRFWCITLITSSNKNIIQLNKLLYHTFPAFLVDTACLVLGRKPRLLKTYKKIEKFVGVLEYFFLRDWKFSNDNVQSLYNALSSADKETFMLSIANVHWLDFFKTYVYGIRKYILKDPDDNLEESKVRLRRFEIANTVIKNTVALVAFNYLWTGICSSIRAAITDGV